MSDYRDSIDVLLLGITCDNIPDVCYFRESGMLDFLDPEEREGGVILGYGETSYLGDVGAERSAVEEGSTRGCMRFPSYYKIIVRSRLTICS